MERDDVITLTYDMLLYLVPVLNGFPRTQKFMLGDRIQTYVMDILEDLIEAYYSPKSSKKVHLKQANMKLEKLRYLIRLSKDLKCINFKRYGVISQKVDDIGKSIGGWMKVVV